MEIFETQLPGIGFRYDFATEAGDQAGVVVRRDGRRTIVQYDRDDPDATRSTIDLSTAESAAMVELLGGTRVTERLGKLRFDVEGLAIEWVGIPPQGGLGGHTIGEGRVRTLTGSSVVAVLRSEVSYPGPGPDFLLEAGDKVLVIGTADGVRRAEDLLAG